MKIVRAMKTTRCRVIVAAFIGVALFVSVALAYVAWREVARNFHRVAPEEESAVLLIRRMGGMLGKEGPDRHVISVNLSGTDVRDTDLHQLAGLRHLRHLDLSNTRVTDRGVTILDCLETLEYIDLSHTAVTCEGVRVLSSQNSRLKMIGCAGIEK